MRNAFCLTFCLLCFGVSRVQAQQLDHVLGEILVKLKSKKDFLQLQQKAAQQASFGSEISLLPSDEPDFDLYRLQFNYNNINERDLLHWLLRQETVEMAQFNHLLHWRETTPNDPLFLRQWQYLNAGNNGGVINMDLDADLAWDITTGGLSPEGDTIVVAVIDNGFYLNHPDFQGNIWVNHLEIPNNNRDDDDNGYVDDYLGWNISNQTDQISPPGISEHGTAVAGIIGAKGNNGLGITGVNWQVKLMIISNPELVDEYRALQAYHYVLKMREMYNDTQGQEGAFIVATNASWGIDNAFPEDAPTWCQLYDLLGQAGVLNCGATSNRAVNVDVEGDLPTTCPSDYLIAVTNLDWNGNKVAEAGYGPVNIDLGAFGDQVYTASNTSPTYHSFLGTSAATPHVTGAIALLYSVPCSNLTHLAKTDPANAALTARRYLLEGIKSNNSLKNITNTGGQLNLYNSVKMALDACGTCPKPQRLQVENVKGDAANLVWKNPYYGQSASLRWREKGSNTWTLVNVAVSPYKLKGLDSCRDYQFQVAVVCADNEQSDYSNIFEFRSDDCCAAPKNIQALPLSEKNIYIHWNAVGVADAYLLQYRELGQSVWQEMPIATTSIQLEDLHPCQEYELMIRSACTNILDTTNSEVFVVSTRGCGNCIDLNYCHPQGSTKYEWIERVKINDLDNLSSYSNGYQRFTNISTSLVTYQSYSIELQPGFMNPQSPDKEKFKMWIDYNQDGDFGDLEELVFISDLGQTGLQQGIINIPPTALEGSTRLRVGMEYDFNNPEGKNACNGDFFYGEIEDYCIEIIAGTAQCTYPNSLEIMEVSESFATITWENYPNDYSTNNIRYRSANTGGWIEQKNVKPPYFLYPLESCESYLVQIEANCNNGGISGYSEEKELITSCNPNTRSSGKISQLIASPNPFTNHLTVRFFLEQKTPIFVQIFSLDGRVMYGKHFGMNDKGPNELALQWSDPWAAGLYLLRIQSDNGTSTAKILHQ